MSILVNPTRQKSATHRAAEEIRRLIFCGELTADSNHLESELADRLGISRTPVREATLILQASGLLEVQPRKGVRINSISIDDLSDIYQLLIELECLSARLAAEQQYAEQQLEGLRESLRLMNNALVESNLERWADADESFHIRLSQLGHNSRIEPFLQNLNDLVRRPRFVCFNLHPMSTPSIEGHESVYNAVLAGDASEATKLQRIHRQNASKTLIGILQKSGFKKV